jgi:hypothetical protein
MMLDVIMEVTGMELNKRHEPIGRVPIVGRSDLHFGQRLLPVVLPDVHLDIHDLVCIFMDVVEQHERTVRISD